MGMADCMSRNPDQVATPPSTYNADFIIAQINVIKYRLNIICKRGRPKKENTEKDKHTIKIVRCRSRPRKHAINTQNVKRTAQQSTTTAPHDSNTQTTTGMESPHEYNNLKKSMEPSHDSKLLNFGVKSPHDSTTTKLQAKNSWDNNKPSHLNEQRSETSRTKTNYSNNHSLRSIRQKASEQITNTENDITHDKTVLNHTINKSHLPIPLSPSQQHLQNLLLSTPNKMSKSTKTPNCQASPPKSKFSISNFLSPSNSPSAENQQHPQDKELNDKIQRVFNMKLIAAMINRDSVLGKWETVSSPTSTHNGCILVDNKLAIPHVMKEPVMDILHATDPGAWGMTELDQRLWWPYINRDLINKSMTCKPCTEFGKNLKNIMPKTKLAPSHDAQNLTKKYKSISVVQL